MTNYFITAKNHIELNNSLERLKTAAPEHTQKLRLHITTINDSATSYWVKTNPHDQPIHATHNGNECILTTTHKTTNTAYTLITPLWGSDQISIQNLLEIEFQKAIAFNSLTIQAMSRISPWYIFQLIRKDLPNHSQYELNKWFTTGGIKDLNIITEEVSIIASLNQKINSTPFSSYQACIWNDRPDLQASFGNQFPFIFPMASGAWARIRQTH